MTNLFKGVFKKIPLLNKTVLAVKKLVVKEKRFINSGQYWIDRYDNGGNSGYGSYENYAQFKATVINAFVKENNIKTVIEFGCGDGNQLKYLDIPFYTGYDISPKAIAICKDIFKDDLSKSFRLMNEYAPVQADLALSLDVIYHLIEDDIYDDYMKRLFASANKFVIIYAWDLYQKNEDRKDAHVKHRSFSKWISENKPEFVLQSYIPNNSTAHFYIYKLTNKEV